MHVTKIKIKNLYGITEYESDGGSVELTGENGAGKSSVIDAIKYALTNKSDRKYIVRNGETEGEILIETDTGLRINRKARTNQADYKSVKQNGREVGSPESFLRDIFSPLQLSPVEFLEKTEKEQNAIILDMINYNWDLNAIREWFGELPAWVSYDQNILSVLNDIQSEKGKYFLDRQDINRDIRNKRAFIEDIAATIPAGYQAEKWENEDLGGLYREIERIRKQNEEIEKARRVVDDQDKKVRAFEAEKEIALAALDRELSAERERLVKETERLQAQLKENQQSIAALGERKASREEVILQKFRADVAGYEAKVEEYRELAGKETEDFSALQEQAAHTEEMKGHLREYRRMVSLQEEVESLKEESEDLTRKIEKARSLPGEILETATILIKGLTVKDGIPLINGLPVSNLSDGEKLDLCVDVAVQNQTGLQLVLIDGVEKLSSKMRESLYQKCKEKGLQFIATRTTDDDELTVITL